MYESLKRMWLADRITEAELDRAITFGWITEEQKQQLIDLKYPPEPEEPGEDEETPTEPTE